MANMTRDEVEKVRQTIRQMKPGQLFYRMLVEELTRLGRWKAKPRGDGGGVRKLRNNGRKIKEIY